MTHFLRYFRQPSPHAPKKQARGQAVRIDPKAPQRLDVPLPMSQRQRDARNREIRALAAQGVARQDIAERYRLSVDTIARIVRVVRV